MIIALWKHRAFYYEVYLCAKNAQTDILMNPLDIGLFKLVDFDEVNSTDFDQNK